MKKLIHPSHLPEHPFNALGVHIFAGGFTAGVSQHFNILGHFETGKTLANSNSHIAQHNFPGLDVFHPRDKWPLDELKNADLGLVYCNPPCALWSPIGVTCLRGKDAWRTDKRVQCWKDCLDVGIASETKCLVIESVPRAFSETGGRDLVVEFAHEMQGRGYEVTLLFTDSAQCGIAQRRKRFFFVAHRVQIDFKSDRSPDLSVREALSGIEPDECWPVYEPHARALAENRPGEGIRDTWERITPDSAKELNKHGQVCRRPMFMHHRVHPDRPSGAIAGNYYYHWEENRMLSIRELKILCGYPDWFTFPEGVKVHHKIAALCQAVMPPVGEWVARQVHRGLELDRPARTGQCRIVDFRKDPEVVTEVEIA
jgi:site-specific DNA-cytosine methylase